ncbi:hypothetical protein BDF21DRAFT_393024 [Thamnidium elegans]|uniref:RNA polymerase II subunit A C-terminal domain phosphatase n=1 Tax=Thamnidium elegans TaxID=101142 RepID=A0A8H7SX51_9FUNG|nr:hypothetical protein INT48_008118 [Thamnidium elegans]KAI8047873.1 hypothetical protein BDF21DRAFT_393024 [Thamnidium elegans]
MSCQHENLEGGKCTSPGCSFCLHEVKFGGLCAVCGNVIEDETSDQIKMTHKDTGITVSLNEAKRLEQQDEKRLLDQRKLSLIVDLDQTILHATWEPSIADWVKERKERNSDSVKDIRQFTLDGSPLIYSIKLRPGLSDFLKDMSKKYEMHIYTMGTRSYAEAVVKEIDPTGELFHDRILSRDENGSMTKKRLERLFPSDTSKVVVLDDRGDVWDYSPNLIQIKPYEYFIGIGDINSPFAQPKKDIIPSAESLAKPSNIIKDTEDKSINQAQSEINDNKNKEFEANNSNKEPESNDNNKETETNDNNKEPEANDSNKEPNVTTENPVNKDPEANTDNQKPDDKEAKPNDKDIETSTLNDNNNTASDDSSENDEQDIYSDTEDDEEADVKSSTSKSKDAHVFKVPAPVQKAETHLPNTHDADDILRVTRRALLDVHNIFFNDLLKRNQKPQVSIILNSLKRRVFRDVNVVFSGIIPLHQTKPEDSWIWRMASSFGANCFHELTGKITHLIAANPGTDKAITARKYGHIKVVSPAWITDSVWNWQRQDESKYLLPTIDASPEESDIEDPESTQLEIDFDWEDDEVDEILDDESDGGLDDDFNLSSNEVEPNVNTQEPSPPSHDNSDSEGEYSGLLEVEEENNRSDNSDGDDDDDDMLFDEESLNADLDEMFANDDSDSDSDSSSRKRDRDDNEGDKHIVKKLK